MAINWAADDQSDRFENIFPTERILEAHLGSSECSLQECNSYAVGQYAV